MTSSTLESPPAPPGAADPAGDAVAVGVTFSDDAMTVRLADGRAVSVPLAWYPRLRAGTPGERENWRPIAGGRGVHWPDLDEDVAPAHLLAGRRSAESRRSLDRWLAGRSA